MNTLFSIGNMIYGLFLTWAMFVLAAALASFFVDIKIALAMIPVAGLILIAGASIRYLFTGYFVFNTFGVPFLKPQHWETVEEEDDEA